ncbi:DUF4253 domain-containing protein [Streptomyces alanosinicus]|uniref:DUF4253 domain-containing protein n=1 Tax=Streptomyces alanosinicus TaxID=68171 RepID=A0A919D869_9ACTN|nr:DUF4253 domain-containing protein [Streptomyces alanosinicus]GHE15766.1 hypothetical protein GCM10010339_91470 [Streptomyces alanosinicus]
MATLPNPLPTLATDPSGRSLGLRLPPGRLVDTADDGPWHEPLLWHAQKLAAPGTWKALGAPAARAGLLPVLVDVGGAGGGLDDWALMPGEVSYPGDHDAEDVLVEYWQEETEDGEIAEEIEPFGSEWPGLAPAAVRSADPDTRAAQVADTLAEGTGGDPEPAVEETHLALVPARRSADIPAAIGWSGPVNYEGDVARVCAVLRSWEDRFGIRVVALGPDTLVVSVAAPPATQQDAEAVAAEHFAFCPDNVLQGERDTLRAYAKDLIGASSWTFWWD